jgi:hypothetical protein
MTTENIHSSDSGGRRQDQIIKSHLKLWYNNWGHLYSIHSLDDVATKRNLLGIESGIGDFETVEAKVAE